MNFKDLSIIDFLDYISGKRKFQDIESIISKSDMVEYLENRTSNFTKDRFDMVIKEIRDYAKRIEFELYDVDNDFPDELHYAGRCPYNIIGQIRPAIKFEFNEKDSLRERIEIITNHPLLELQSLYIRELYTFSDIAENEYKRVCETATTEPETIAPNIKSQLFLKQKNALLESVGVKRYEEMGMYEFFVYMTYDEHFNMSDTELYSYIMKKTNNFDRKTFELFIKEFNFLSGSIKYIFPEIKDGKCLQLEEEISILEFMEKLDNMKLNILNDQISNLSIIEKKKIITEFNDNRIKFAELFVNKFSAEMKILYLENEVHKIDKEYDLGLYDRYKTIISFSQTLSGMSEELFPEPLETTKEKPPHRNKQPLTFTGLFKPEYVIKIDKFYKRLIVTGLIDENHIWRETTIKNEPAKVYFWLLNNGVLKINKPTPALICFCKEFGITAYKDTEPTPAIEIRAVTVKNLLNSILSDEEMKYYEKVFLPFLIK